MMPEPLLVPFPEVPVVEELEVSSAVSETLQKIDMLRQVQASTSGAQICDQCY